MNLTIPNYTIYEVKQYQGCDNYIEKYNSHNKDDTEEVCSKFKTLFPDKTFVIEYTSDIIGLF